MRAQIILRMLTLKHFGLEEKMQYCSKCKIQIRGYKKVCPLCQGKLTGDPELPIYPVLKKHVSRVSLLRIATFLMAALEIVMLSARFLVSREVDTDAPWISLVMVVDFVVWLDIAMALMLRNNILKIVTFQAYALMAAVIGIDYYTGLHGWALIWVVPLLFLGLAIFTFSIGFATHAHLEDYLYYLVLSTVMAQLQWIPVLNGINTFTWPAVICMTAFLILAAAVIVFRFHDLKNASAKMWNM